MCSEERLANGIKNVYISFSHWVQMDRNIGTSDPRTVEYDLLVGFRPFGQLTSTYRSKTWTILHWQRKGTVQCSHNQHGGQDDTDLLQAWNRFLRPSSSVADLYFGQSPKQASKKHSQNISRTAPTVTCHSSVPYIAILGRPSDDFMANWEGGDNDAPSLRIASAGINSTTFSKIVANIL